MIGGPAQLDLIERTAPPQAVGIRILPGDPPRVVMQRRLAELEAMEQHLDQGRSMTDTEQAELVLLRGYLARPTKAA
jgi:hypothetical protein